MSFWELILGPFSQAFAPWLKPLVTSLPLVTLLVITWPSEQFDFETLDSYSEKWTFYQLCNVYYQTMQCKTFYGIAISHAFL